MLGPHEKQSLKIILLIITVSILSGCSAKPYFVKHNENNLSQSNVTVFVVSHEWHTGFVVPVDMISNKIPELKKRFISAKSIEFGWGDKGFYQANEITSRLTLRAIFWPTDTVIHAVAVPGDVFEYFPNSEIIPINLNQKEYENLIQFISNSFQRDHKGNVTALKNGIYGNSQFYAGVGSYYLLNTCNVWTAKGLKSSGSKINTTFKLTAGSIMNYLRSEGPP